jgi:hypothetical protein
MSTWPLTQCMRRSSPGLTASDLGKLIVRPSAAPTVPPLSCHGCILGCLHQSHLCFEIGTRESSLIEVSEVAPIKQDLGTWYRTKTDLKLL